MKLIALGAAVGLLCLPATVRAEACLDISEANSKVTFTGKLTTQLFAGPPNYESIADGDAEERAFILELQARQCANDGGQFLEQDQSFDRVHLSSMEPALLRILSAAVGRDVTVTGEAFGSHTGHHHAPVVMMVEQVATR